MPRLEYFLVSESLSVDQETNNVSVFSILEELSGPLPITIFRLVAISSWNIEADERDRDYQVALRVRLPSGEVMPESDKFKVNFTTTRMRHRIFQHVHGLRVNEAGELTVELLLDGKQEASHKISIHARHEEA